MESREASSCGSEEGFNLKTASSDQGRFVAQQKSGEVQFHRQVASLADGNELSMTAGYRRCLDFDPKDIEGQDFCGYWLENGWLVAVVADGVSQSFMGHLAADECGRGILEILWKRHGQDTSTEALVDGLQTRQPQLAERVAKWEISPGVPEMVRFELEKKRGTTGSQTVFAAVSMDLRAGRGEVFILGDVTATVATADGSRKELAADARGRWSSARGMRGELARHEVQDIVSLMLHSDGTGNDWGSDPLAVEVEENFAGLAQEMAGRDDLSFVAMRIQPKDRAERGVEPKSEPLRGLRSPAAGAETPSSVDAAHGQTVPQTFIPLTSVETGNRSGRGTESRQPLLSKSDLRLIAAGGRSELAVPGGLRSHDPRSARTGWGLPLRCVAVFLLCVAVAVVAYKMGAGSNVGSVASMPDASEPSDQTASNPTPTGAPVVQKSNVAPRPTVPILTPPPAAVDSSVPSSHRSAVRDSVGGPLTASAPDGGGQPTTPAHRDASASADSAG